jgi:hypothetical protein
MNRKLVLGSVFLIALSIAAYVLLVVIPGKVARQAYDGAKQLGRDIENAFNFTPEVTVNNTVVLQQQSPILELATLSQTFQHQYKWTNTWLKSTKEIRISGTFVAKVGFNLDRRFAVQVDDDKATVFLPEPIILSLEPQGDVKFEDENGIWNLVKDEDRSRALNAFQLDGRRYAQQADFVAQAKAEAEKKISDILKLHVKEVQFIYVTEPIRSVQIEKP